MKIFLLLLTLLQAPPSFENIKESELEEVFNRTYNQTRNLFLDMGAENMAKGLLEKYPDDPYVYDLWASTEWLLIGRELNLRADEQKDITNLINYRERAENYRRMVEKGLALTENKTDEKTLFARAVLKFDQAKFSARYESRLTGLKKADREAAEGIKILKQTIKANPNFCSAYLFLGGNRLQLSTRPNFAERLLVWKFSKVYAELYSIDKDVFNEKKSVEWLEKSYYFCDVDHPWEKKTWLETAFLLAGAYRNYHKKMPVKEEVSVLPKEISLLKSLSARFPQNQDLARMLSERELRLKVLQNYFSKK